MPGIKLSPEDLSQLADHLKQFWPESLQVYNVVRNIQLISLALRVWTDKWPKPDAVLISVDEENCKNGCIQRSVRHGGDGNYVEKIVLRLFVFIFGRNLPALTTLLIDKSEVVVDTSRSIMFPAFSFELSRHIANLFPDIEFLGYSVDMYWIKTKEKLIKTSMPEGFRKGPMTKEVAIEVAEHSPYASEGFTDIVLQGALKGFPYIVLYEESSNKPVGWYMQTCPLGSLNHLMVVEEFRGRGLGKYLVSNLAIDVLQKDGVAFLYIGEDNVISKKLHEDLGFEQCGKCAYREIKNI